MEILRGRAAEEEKQPEPLLALWPDPVQPVAWPAFLMGDGENPNTLFCSEEYYSKWESGRSARRISRSAGRSRSLGNETGLVITHSMTIRSSSRKSCPSPFLRPSYQAAASFISWTASGARRPGFIRP